MIQHALNIPDLDGAPEQVLHTAAALATAPLEDLLGTTFQRGAVSDVFLIEPDTSHTVTRFPTKLKLSRGFLDAGAAVTLAVEPLVDGAFQVPATEYTAEFTIDHEAGLLIVPARLTGWYSVSYTAGFEVDADSDVVTTMLPEWLESAALACISVIYQNLNQRHALNGLDEKSQKLAQAALTQLPGGIISGLRSYVRWFPTANSPQWSS